MTDNDCYDVISNNNKTINKSPKYKLDFSILENEQKKMNKYCEDYLKKKNNNNNNRSAAVVVVVENTKRKRKITNGDDDDNDDDDDDEVIVQKKKGKKKKIKKYCTRKLLEICFNDKHKYYNKYLSIIVVLFLCNDERYFSSSSSSNKEYDEKKSIKFLKTITNDKLKKILIEYKWDNFLNFIFETFKKQKKLNVEILIENFYNIPIDEAVSAAAAAASSSNEEEKFIFENESVIIENLNCINFENLKRYKKNNLLKIFENNYENDKLNC